MVCAKGDAGSRNDRIAGQMIFLKHVRCDLGSEGLSADRRFRTGSAGEHQFRGEGALRIALLIIIMRDEHD